LRTKLLPNERRFVAQVTLAVTGKPAHKKTVQCERHRTGKGLIAFWGGSRRREELVAVRALMGWRSAGPGEREEKREEKREGGGRPDALAVV